MKSNIKFGKDCQSVIDKATYSAGFGREAVCGNSGRHIDDDCLICRSAFRALMSMSKIVSTCAAVINTT